MIKDEDVEEEDPVPLGTPRRLTMKVVIHQVAYSPSGTRSVLQSASYNFKNAIPQTSGSGVLSRNPRSNVAPHRKRVKKMGSPWERSSTIPAFNPIFFTRARCRARAEPRRARCLSWGELKPLCCA